MLGSKNSKVCFYCGSLANTKDHVPSKNLLESPFPYNLLTVPACSQCNNSFSFDEEYFLNVIVETTTNETLISKKRNGGNVFRARLRAPKLAKRIEESLTLEEDGRIYLACEMTRIERVVEKNACGLFFHKYDQIANLSAFKCVAAYAYSVIESRSADIFMLTFSEKFQPKRWTVIQQDVFSYIVVRDWRRANRLSMIINIHNSFWFVVDIPFPKQSRKKQKSKFKASQLSLFKQ